MHKHSDQFYAAVRALSGAGSIKKRLTSAYDDHLAHLLSEELPDCIRSRFEELRRTMLSVKPLGGESPVLASVRKMSTAEATRCANLIVTLFNEMHRGEDNPERRDQPSASVSRTALLAKRYQSLN